MKHDYAAPNKLLLYCKASHFIIACILQIDSLSILDQVLNRKLVHISVGMVFLLFWPLFSSGSYAPFFAALAPGINIIRMLLIGLGIMRDESVVKSMSRHGNYRELLKGPLYYACTITLATAIFWRTSPLAIAAICNLCAGDVDLMCAHGKRPFSRWCFEKCVADIVGRQFGKEKLPYNPSKSYAGSLAMFLAGFISSIGYMHYYHSFGFVEESWFMALGFSLVSLATAFVESLPISSELDDNLTCKAPFPWRREELVVVTCPLLIK
ncbi:probable phytol kinase 2, chloroplastic isoform X2 [Ananas comosus]|uniref:Probable phytol kinase 2, chloroplastic isoform X2 n=1 Tax=Ananas comosus TaxID=4615 RepID=A0A6P5G7X5_ANACO|nr:probable phytol kinase 2, chloroplastic isoform X2 [Ananas comosus]XP_020101900.1 probable phytol kinase 2, chloroplastic isoform X2 [Ananas comosus]